MKKPIPPYFEYAPHSAKAEDKRIRDFRAEHDPDCPRETARLYYSNAWILFFSTLSMACITYIVWQYYPIIADICEAIDNFMESLPAGWWTIFILSCIASIILFWRGRKDRKNGIV